MTQRGQELLDRLVYHKSKGLEWCVLAEEIKEFLDTEASDEDKKEIQKYTEMLSIMCAAIVNLQIEAGEQNSSIWDTPYIKYATHYPFVHDKMTCGEYRIEKEYYKNNMESVRLGNYKPLWKQRLEENDTGIFKTSK